MEILTGLRERLFQDNTPKTGQGITRDEARQLLSLSGAPLIELLALANSVREHYFGDVVNLCSIVNAKSGNCSEDCTFCAQSRYNKTNIERYPMKSAEEIVSSALDAANNGAINFGIVTSGHRLSDQDFENVLSAIRSIKKQTSLDVCASLGRLTKEQLTQLKTAGGRKYHHNLETSRSHFEKICTTHSYSERLETIKTARSVGLEVCCGGILGLGETPEQRLELAETLAELDVDSIPINILVPVPGTPLADQPPIPPIPPMEILKTIAIFRLMLPGKMIKLAGGREHNLGDLQALTLTSGANGLMIGNYLTTPGRLPSQDLKMIKQLGLKPGVSNDLENSV